MSGATWPSSPPGLGPDSSGRRSPGNPELQLTHPWRGGEGSGALPHPMLTADRRDAGRPSSSTTPPGRRTDTISRTGPDYTYNRGKSGTILVPYQNSTKTASRFPPGLYNIAITVTFSCTHRLAAHISQLHTSLSCTDLSAVHISQLYISLSCIHLSQLYTSLSCTHL